MSKEMIYSFSRLESFKGCQYGFYLTYIKKYESEDNIYSFLGSEVHELLEAMQAGKLDNDSALDMFEESLDDAEMLGYEFMSENVRRKYIENIKNYIENFKPIECEEYDIEKEFLIDIDGVKIKGFIDFYYKNKEGKVEIVDYKTSSKFSAKDLPEKTRQLILYGMALESEGLEVERVGFDMLKYYAKPWRNKMVLKERCELPLDELEYQENRGFVFREYNEEAKQDVKNYIKKIVEEINSKDFDNEDDWEPVPNCKNDFFCKTLCGHYNICKYQK